MKKIQSKFTVFFENPFWVGVYERVFQDTLEVCKITFGAEPRDYEIYDFLLNHWDKLKFSSPVKFHGNRDVKINPKRMQREIKKQIIEKGIGTKSQQALKIQQEENKILRQQKNRKEKELEKQLQFQLRQQKKKKKHRGK